MIKLLMHVAKWIKLKHIILSKIKLTQKATSCTIQFIFWKRQIHMDWNHIRTGEIWSRLNAKEAKAIISCGGKILYLNCAGSSVTVEKIIQLHCTFYLLHYTFKNITLELQILCKDNNTDFISYVYVKLKLSYVKHIYFQ